MVKRRTPAVEIFPLTDDVLHEAAVTMRDDDAVECYRALNKNPRESLLWCREQSESCWSFGVKIDGDLVGVGGLAQRSVLSDRGYPWAFSTRSAGKHKRRFALVSKLIVERMRDMCPGGLFVLIDAEYCTAVRWAEWLGFETSSPINCGPAGYPFVPATIGGFHAAA